jgi:hypothetical protein
VHKARLWIVDEGQYSWLHSVARVRAIVLLASWRVVLQVALVLCQLTL